MPEPNGTARLDRIEKILEMFIADHERIRQEHQEFQEAFERDLKQLLIAQVLMNDSLQKLEKRMAENTGQLEILRERDKDQDARIAALDARVDKLVIAIGELIRSRAL